jgi:hypothetical protein
MKPKNIEELNTNGNTDGEVINNIDNFIDINKF